MPAIGLDEPRRSVTGNRLVERGPRKVGLARTIASRSARYHRTAHRDVESGCDGACHADQDVSGL